MCKNNPITILALFALASLSFSCSLDINPFGSDQYTEAGKIRGQLIHAKDGKPIPGVFVQASFFGGSGLLGTGKTDSKFAYTDENGYFQLPEMKNGNSSYNLSFSLDTILFPGYFIANAGQLNEGKAITDMYVAIKPTLLKLKLECDTSIVEYTFSNYFTSIFNYNKGYYSNYPQSGLSTKRYLVFNWIPAVRKSVYIQFGVKNMVLDSTAILTVRDTMTIGDTCYGWASF